MATVLMGSSRPGKFACLSFCCAPKKLRVKGEPSAPLSDGDRGTRSDVLRSHS